MSVAPGTVVVLNGTSSSGKTSIAEALRAAGEERWFWIAMDRFGEMAPHRPQEGQRISAFEALFQTVVMVSRAGWDTVLDIVLVNPWVKRKCCEAIRELPVYLVGVHCPLDELERRETARGDRKVGLARWQLERVHADLMYDVEVDTSSMSAEECAQAIERRIGDGSGPKAFRQLLDPQNGAVTGPERG